MRALPYIQSHACRDDKLVMSQHKGIYTSAIAGYIIHPGIYEGNRSGTMQAFEIEAALITGWLTKGRGTKIMNPALRGVASYTHNWNIRPWSAPC